MKKGFTLAEVLITLAIIGVVAALTIPIVVNNYQKKAQYTAFMKMYNTFQTAMQMSAAQNGSASQWSAEDSDGIFTTYIAPYLKISKTCESASDCFAADYVNLSGESYEFTQGYPSGDAVMLDDGSVLRVECYIYESNSLGDIYFFFDTNGQKGPNILGRDAFELFYDKSKGAIIPYEYETSLVDGDSGQPANCNPASNNSYNGLGCPARLIQEGKMDY